jgi:GTP-binding protein HflX
VLKEIGADGIPQILIWNKIDLALGTAEAAPSTPAGSGQAPDRTPDSAPDAAGGAPMRMARYAPGIERDEYDKISRVYLSARTREGIEYLRQALVERAVAFRAGGAGQDPTADVNGASAVSVF